MNYFKSNMDFLIFFKGLSGNNYVEGEKCEKKAVVHEAHFGDIVAIFGL